MHACIDIYILISSECWLQAVFQGLIAATAREQGTRGSSRRGQMQEQSDKQSPVKQRASPWGARKLKDQR